MQPESPPRMTEMMTYFVQEIPDTWNLLSYRMKFAKDILECYPICGAKHGFVFQFAVLGKDKNGLVRGFTLALN